MTFGAETWGPMLLQAVASTGSGILTGMGANKETKTQKTQRKLIDQLIASLTSGEGPFADLFNMDENAFQKSFVDPARSMFNNQISPMIQQQYIASGQQRGTGLDDTLTRAGVDLDTMLNQQLMNYQQKALDRKQGTIDSILRAGSGVAERSTGQDAASGFGGYLSSQGFADSTANLFKKPTPATDTTRKGFEAS